MKKPTFKRPQIKRPTLPSLKAAPDPLNGLPETGSAETDAEQELDAVQSGFRDRAKKEARRFQDATDTGYYCCIVMENRDQVDALLEHLRGMGASIPEDLYIDGREIARVLRCELPRRGQGGGTPGKVDKTFAGMVREE